MKTKNFDAIEMVRSIRDKSSREYYANKKKWLKELSELQKSEIKTNRRTKKSKRKSEHV